MAVITTELRILTTGTAQAVQDFNTVAQASNRMSQGAGGAGSGRGAQSFVQNQSMTGSLLSAVGITGSLLTVVDKFELLKFRADAAGISMSSALSKLGPGIVIGAAIGYAIKLMQDYAKETDSMWGSLKIVYKDNEEALRNFEDLGTGVFASIHNGWGLIIDDAAQYHEKKEGITFASAPTQKELAQKGKEVAQSKSDAQSHTKLQLEKSFMRFKPETEMEEALRIAKERGAKGRIELDAIAEEVTQRHEAVKVREGQEKERKSAESKRMAEEDTIWSQFFKLRDDAVKRGEHNVQAETAIASLATKGQTREGKELDALNDQLAAAKDAEKYAIEDKRTAREDAVKKKFGDKLESITDRKRDLESSIAKGPQFAGAAEAGSTEAYSAIIRNQYSNAGKENAELEKLNQEQVTLQGEMKTALEEIARNSQPQPTVASIGSGV